MYVTSYASNHHLHSLSGAATWALSCVRYWTLEVNPGFFFETVPMTLGFVAMQRQTSVKVDTERSANGEWTFVVTAQKLHHRAGCCTFCLRIARFALFLLQIDLCSSPSAGSAWHVCAKNVDHTTAVRKKRNCMTDGNDSDGTETNGRIDDETTRNPLLKTSDKNESRNTLLYIFNHTFYFPNCRSTTSTVSITTQPCQDS